MWVRGFSVVSTFTSLATTTSWERNWPEPPFLSAGEDRLGVVFHIPVLGLWDPEDGGELPGGVGSGTFDEVTSFLFDPRERWAWLGTKKGTLIRLVPADVRGLAQVKVKNRSVTALASPGNFKVMAIGGEDGSIRFLDPKSGKLDAKRVLEAHADPVSDLAYDAKGSLLASAAGSAVHLWSKKGKAPKLELEVQGRVLAVALDPKGRWVAVGTASGRLELFDTKKGTSLGQVQVEGQVRDLLTVDSGKRLAVACEGLSMLAVPK